jgi:hypothetical protein
MELAKLNGNRQLTAQNDLWLEFTQKRVDYSFPPHKKPNPALGEFVFVGQT